MRSTPLSIIGATMIAAYAWCDDHRMIAPELYPFLAIIFVCWFIATFFAVILED
jgi:hypothetical protein